MEQSKDWKAFEKAVNEQDTEKFYNLMRYWRRIGEEFAYNDTYTEIHLLREMPYRDIHAESAEFLKILAELKIEYDDSDIYGKATEMLIQAIADGDESKIKQLSRFIYLLGVRESTKRITERVDECLNLIHEKNVAVKTKITTGANIDIADVRHLINDGSSDLDYYKTVGKIAAAWEDVGFVVEMQKMIAVIGEYHRLKRDSESLRFFVEKDRNEYGKRK